MVYSVLIPKAGLTPRAQPLLTNLPQCRYYPRCLSRVIIIMEMTGREDARTPEMILVTVINFSYLNLNPLRPLFFFIPYALQGHSMASYFRFFKEPGANRSVIVALIHMQRACQTINILI